MSDYKAKWWVIFTTGKLDYAREEYTPSRFRPGMTDDEAGATAWAEAQVKSHKSIDGFRVERW